MSQTVQEHRQSSPQKAACAVVTISDTRTLQTDSGGKLIVELLEAAGHAAAERLIVRDEPVRLRFELTRLVNQAGIDAVLMTGGTGLSSRDQTYETVAQMLTKPIAGYGELFRWLSYQEIGAAAMLSRAVGGLVGRTPVFTMPGSPAAVRLAMEKLILPELGHFLRESRR